MKMMGRICFDNFHKKFIKLFFQNLLTIKGFCVIIDTSKPQGKFKEIDYGIRNCCFALAVRYHGRNVPVQIG